MGYLHKEDKNFNIFSNKYFDLYAYEFNDGGNIRVMPTHQLTKCSESQLDFILEDNRKFYPDSICIDRPEDLNLRGNWFTKNHSLMAITVAACQPVPGVRECASDKEIADFLSETPFYFAY